MLFRRCARAASRTASVPCGVPRPRALQVTEGHPVVAVSWSPTGDAFLVVTSYSQVGRAAGVLAGAAAGAWPQRGRAMPPGCPLPAGVPIGGHAPLCRWPTACAAKGVQPGGQGAGGASQGRHVHSRHEEHQGCVHRRKRKRPPAACHSHAAAACRPHWCSSRWQQAAANAPRPLAAPRRRPRDQLHGRRVAPGGEDHGPDEQRGRHTAGVGRDGGRAEDGDQAAGALLRWSHLGLTVACAALEPPWPSQGVHLACTSSPQLVCTWPAGYAGLPAPACIGSSPPTPLTASPPLQLSKPGRVSVTSCSYSTDGRLIAAGLADGQIQLWDVRGEFWCHHATCRR